jgi:DME family drug/metabolite transporter
MKTMLGELAALGAAASWTISALLYRKALREIKPVSANIIRLTCTALVLLTFLTMLGKFEALASLPLDVLVLAAISGLIGLGIGDTLYMVSLKSIGVARAVPVTCTYPLFNLLWAVFLVGEPITLPIVLGAIIIVFGIWLLSQENNTEMRKKYLLKGMAFALTTAVVWSVSITMINVAVRTKPDLDHALAINTVRVIAIALSMLASTPIIDKSLGFLKANKRTVATLIAGGIVALGLGWFFLTFSFIETLESRAVPISSTTPLFSTFAGFALLHEKITVKNAIGSVVIVIGIFLIFLIR